MQVARPRSFCWGSSRIKHRPDVRRLCHNGQERVAVSSLGALRPTTRMTPGASHSIRPPTIKEMCRGAAYAYSQPQPKYRYQLSWSWFLVRCWDPRA